ncbi:hypothetical protein Mal64_19270 [Pseudobythopirellula maris]|uniref:Uncharacterized protein n=1 Tax=Pseudobythopirellula maris TaxID=2527991 RepID=A0A5C5ZMX3_9BACT|nr:hypothetical protein [Pseudobythopirellula maris]TWT88446.1 hypothetical protein Mal64_19270 [Pseudobythopirellula maris]
MVISGALRKLAAREALAECELLVAAPTAWPLPPSDPEPRSAPAPKNAWPVTEIAVGEAGVIREATAAAPAAEKAPSPPARQTPSPQERVRDRPEPQGDSGRGYAEVLDFKSALIESTALTDPLLRRFVERQRLERQRSGAGGDELPESAGKVVMLVAHRFADARQRLADWDRRLDAHLQQRVALVGDASWRQVAESDPVMRGLLAWFDSCQRRFDWTLLVADGMDETAARVAERCDAVYGLVVDDADWPLRHEAHTEIVQWGVEPAGVMTLQWGATPTRRAA